MPAFYAICPASGCGACTSSIIYRLANSVCCGRVEGIAADRERIFPGRSYQGMREAANGRFSVWLKRNFYEYNKRNV